MLKLRQWAMVIRRDAVALYLAARDPRVPGHVKVLAIVVAAYALSPIDLIPDFIPVIGLLDEMILLPLAMAGIMRLIPAEILTEHRVNAYLLAEPPVSKVAAVAVVAVWILAAFLVGLWVLG